MISFKWRHFEKEVILMAVRWYVAYPLSYRNIEKLMKERGVEINHTTVSRWVVKYSTQLEKKFRQIYKRPVGFSWRMDETYIKIKGNWCYLFQQGFRSFLGLNRLGKTYGQDLLNLACKRALSISAINYKSIQTILKNNLDQQELTRSMDEESITQLEHAYVRGKEYFH